MTIPQDRCFWLSFADPERPQGHQFLGVVVIHAWSLEAALGQCWVLGINPGGEVASIEMDPHGEPALRMPHNRLISYAELVDLRMAAPTPPWEEADA